MKLGFSYIGLIWLVMLFVPNFIWMKNKPKDYEEYAKKENKVLLAIERVGQFRSAYLLELQYSQVHILERCAPLIFPLHGDI